MKILNFFNFFKIKLFLVFYFSFFHFPAFSQFKVEVTGFNQKQISIALPEFKGENNFSYRISQIVKANLERSGQFKAVDTLEIRNLDENSIPVKEVWQKKSADFLLTGSINSEEQINQLEAKFRLWDVVQNKDLGGFAYRMSEENLRFVAHKISDFVYEKITGVRGAFATKIAYVIQQGKNHSLWVADSDGLNAKVILRSSEAIISPAWSFDNKNLAYVSFELQKPVIYSHNLASGQRKILANFKGSNSSPAWSPDGQNLVATLSLRGVSQLYKLNINQNNPQRLLQGGNIETEAVYSLNGKNIYFVSDRSGGPQIYKTSANGGDFQRITFEGNYNISPDISPDNKHLTYISRINGNFKLQIQDLITGKITGITETNYDESPSFAPNGKLILYTTKRQNRNVLMMTTLDGRIKTSLESEQGNIQEPVWSNYLN